MSRNVISGSPETDATAVLRLMADHQISGVPIVDSQQHLVGIVTEYDLLRAITWQNFAGSASNYMRTDVASVPDDATLAEINEVLLTKRIRRVPVTRNDKLVGIVSRRDIVHTASYREQLPIIWSDSDPSQETTKS